MCNILLLTIINLVLIFSYVICCCRFGPSASASSFSSSPISLSAVVVSALQHLLHQLPWYLSLVSALQHLLH